MKWEHKRFKSYGEFIEFLNSIPPRWTLHSWQDVSGQWGSMESTIIRAIFTVSPEA